MIGNIQQQLKRSASRRPFLCLRYDRSTRRLKVEDRNASHLFFAKALQHNREELQQFESWVSHLHDELLKRICERAMMRFIRFAAIERLRDRQTFPAARALLNNSCLPRYLVR
jgi:hypothetical protein